MKKILMAMLFVVLALGLTVPAFAVHPSMPAESVPLIGKSTIEIGGSLRFRGDYRSEIITPTLDSPFDTFLGLSDIFALPAASFDAYLTSIGVDPTDQEAVIGTIFGGTGFPTPVITADLIAAGVPAADISSELLAILSDGIGSKTENRSGYDGRVRLWLNAYVTDNTMGRVHLETGSSNASDGYGWGCDDDRDPAGVYNEGNCKKDELRVLEAYIQHDGSGLLGVPAGFKVGHFPLQLGRGIFLLHTRLGDDAINAYVKPNDNITAEFVMSKFTEGSAANGDDDTDAYAVILNYTSDMLNIGGDVTYVRDKDFLTGDIEGGGADLWNIGVRGDVDIDMLNIYGDVEFQFGEIKLSDIPMLDLDDVDFGGMAALVGATATLGMFDVNAEFGYGSGQEEDDEDFDTFITSLSSVQKFTYVYDYRYLTAALGLNTGIANTTYVKVGAAAKVTPKLTAAGEFYWLQASEEVLDEDELGFELDGRLKYQIDKNLQYFIEGGILFAGDFYDNFDPGEDVDDPYVVRHGIQLSF